MNNQIFHVRIELALPGGDHHPMFSFYNVKAGSKHDAGEKGRKAFAEEFKSTLAYTKVGYVWDAGIHVDTKKLPAI